MARIKLKSIINCSIVTYIGILPLSEEGKKAFLNRGSNRHRMALSGTVTVHHPLYHHDRRLSSHGVNYEKKSRRQILKDGRWQAFLCK